MPFPKTIYVYPEKEGDKTFYLAAVDPDECPDGKVGVYHLEATIALRHQVQIKTNADKPWRAARDR